MDFSEAVNLTCKLSGCPTCPHRPIHRPPLNLPSQDLEAASENARYVMEPGGGKDIKRPPEGRVKLDGDRGRLLAHKPASRIRSSQRISRT